MANGTSSTTIPSRRKSIATTCAPPKLPLFLLESVPHDHPPRGQPALQPMDPSSSFPVSCVHQVQSLERSQKRQDDGEKRPTARSERRHQGIVCLRPLRCAGWAATLIKTCPDITTPSTSPPPDAAVSRWIPATALRAVQHSRAPQAPASGHSRVDKRPPIVGIPGCPISLQSSSSSPPSHLLGHAQTGRSRCCSLLCPKSIFRTKMRCESADPVPVRVCHVGAPRRFFRGLVLYLCHVSQPEPAGR
ncbi:hypothetical protein IWZ01DRAFT_106133 [Phyllosticta capitalensis]